MNTASLAVVVLAPRPWLQIFLDNAFGITLLLIFASAIVGAVVAARRRDRVLRHYDRYNLTMLLEDGRRVWGRCRVFPNGLAFEYVEPHLNRWGNVVQSFLIYQNEFPAIRVLLRRDGELDDAMRRQRRAQLQAFRRPTLLRRASRWALIQFSTMRDAFLKALSTILGQARRRTAGLGTTSSVLLTHDQKLAEIGGVVLGSVGLAHDPVLESLFGRRCVVELRTGDRWIEVPGILKEYSPDWIELLDAEWSHESTAPLARNEPSLPEHRITAQWEGDSVRLQLDESAALPIHLEWRPLESASAFTSAGRAEPGGAWTIALPPDCAGIKLRIKRLEPADVVLPRARCFVRHRGVGRSASAELRQANFPTKP